MLLYTSSYGFMQYRKRTVANAVCIHTTDSPILVCNSKRQRCMLAPFSCCASQKSNCENQSPCSKYLVASIASIASIALAYGLRMLAVDQCPLTLLSGLLSALLFGLELVFSSPCVIFSMKLI